MMADASIQAQIKQRMKTAMKGGPDAKKELSAVRLMVAHVVDSADEPGKRRECVNSYALALARLFLASNDNL